MRGMFKECQQEMVINVGEVFLGGKRENIWEKILGVSLNNTCTVNGKVKKPNF